MIIYEKLWYKTGKNALLGTFWKTMSEKKYQRGILWVARGRIPEGEGRSTLSHLNQLLTSRHPQNLLIQIYWDGS